MLPWEIDLQAITGDNSVLINSAISSLSAIYGGGIVYLEPAVYTISNPILRKSNVFIRGAFKGAWIWDTTVTSGTIVRWTGAAGGNVFIDQPSDDPNKIVNGGISDLTIDGAGVAANGLVSQSAFYPNYARLHCTGVTGNAYYFGTKVTTVVSQNYRARLNDLSAVVVGSANGIVLDGVPGSGRNTCFMTAANCTVTYLNGCGFAISNGDDNCFFSCSASREKGGTGPGIYFGGSSDGTYKAAFGNQFYGWWSNGGINASGGSTPSRGNIVYTTCVDGAPSIYQAAGATLTVVAADGEGGFNGFVRNPLPAG